MKVIEQLLTNAGISPIAGVDEAGRGACAGPLVIASVVLNDPFAPELAVVRDSKEIAENKRDAVFELIHQVAASISVVVVPANEVDSRGVHAANLDGMRRAVQGLAIEPAYVLTDGYAIEGLGLPNLAVWKGDQVVVSISAASVIAKVTRDRIMREKWILNFHSMDLLGTRDISPLLTQKHSMNMVLVRSTDNLLPMWRR